MGCDSAGLQPERRGRIQQTILRTSVASTTPDDEDNADELEESGGMRARPQPRKPSTDEVEAHMIDHYPFQSWCSYCAMAETRSEHHRRKAEDDNEISCDYGFFTDSKDDDRQLTEAEATAVGATHHTRDSGQEKQNDPCRLCALQRNWR